MRHINDFDVYIFDCDGVILDTNELKLAAMRTSLQTKNIKEGEISICIDYFKNNFGKSRYHHIKHFVDEIIQPCNSNSNLIEQLLSEYSNNCKKSYLSAKVNAGFLEFINKIKKHGTCYVASGSDQDELRAVFLENGLSNYFQEILGSPISKRQNIEYITHQHLGKSIIMFGDALADLEAASKNNVDFVFVSELSLSPHSVRSASAFKGNEISNFTDTDTLEVL